MGGERRRVGAASVQLCVVAIALACFGSGCGRVGFLPEARETWVLTTQVRCVHDTECVDPCRSVSGCDNGYCAFGPVDRDDDGDGFIAATCATGTDCDDDPVSCGADCNPGAPEICDARDNDCNPDTEDGSDEAALGSPCDGNDSDLCAEGIFVCEIGFVFCTDNTGDEDDLCNGRDDDCNPLTPDGADEPTLGAPCDGSDADLCPEGVVSCDGFKLYCSDKTPTTLELCNGIDDDCNPETPDAADEARLGEPCDGMDTDLCLEGTITCDGHTLACSDVSSDSLELCNGLDDDCNPNTADGADEPTFGEPCDGTDGDLCHEGVFDCNGETLYCTDETSSEVDLCNGVDDDCNPNTPDGVAEPMFGEPCDGIDSDLCLEGTFSCNGTALYCTDDTPGSVELCNGSDDDCNPDTPDGSGELTLGDDCDGVDSDLCLEGVVACDGVALYCTDSTDSTIEICNGSDDDCNPNTPDGVAEPTFGDACDGADTDLCLEGTIACDGIALYCSDTTSSSHELCNGMDDDCNPTTDDGSDEVTFGSPCDGTDSDLCPEGIIACDGTALYCTDSTSDNPELCNGADDDCDASTPDGSDEITLGEPCDGEDSDLCLEGVVACNGIALYCTDSTGNSEDVCNGQDDDCNPATVDGSAEPTFGNSCDGSDADLCPEGIVACDGVALYCTDTPAPSVDLCNGKDDDCDPTTPDGSSEPTFGNDCDGADSDLCLEGVVSCNGTTLYCTDNTSSSLELCNSIDDDCNPASPDGADEPTVGDDCDGTDSDLCLEGIVICYDARLECTDSTSSTVDLCNGNDDDCNPATADGSGEATYGDDCDGVDFDLCEEGTIACNGTALYCTDISSTTVELCNGADDDCNPATADGSGEPTLGNACDGADLDLCEEGTIACNDSALYCTDSTSSIVDLCNGLDDDCNPATADGFDEPGFGDACDGGDTDFCEEGSNVCIGGSFYCSDLSGDDFEEPGDGLDNDCDSLIDGADPDEWQAANCTRRIELRINSEGLSDSLVDFPLLVVLHSGRVNYSHFAPNGNDLRFFKFGTSGALAHEFEAWDTGGPSYVWVGVPSILASAGESVWMYYDCPDTATYNPEAVWSSDFRGVWHLNEVVSNGGTGATHVDSSGSGTDGEQSGNNTVNAPIAMGQRFDGSDCVYVDDGPALDINQPITVSAWVNFTAFGTARYQYIVSKYELDTNQRSYSLYIREREPRFVLSPNGTNTSIFLQSGYTLAKDRWYHLVATWDGTSNANALRLYVNGRLEGTAPGPSVIFSGSAQATIGCIRTNATGHVFSEARIDEARIRASQASAADVEASYLSHEDLLLTYETPQTAF